MSKTDPKKVQPKETIIPQVVEQNLQAELNYFNIHER
jgi:hypothetical protein